MTVEPNGICNACRADVLQYPALQCPWCTVTRWAAMARQLEVDPHVDPVAAIKGYRAFADMQGEKLRAASSIRAEAARVILSGPEPAAVAKSLHVTMAQLHKWAVKDTQEQACPAGHSRYRDGYQMNTPGSKFVKWGCRRCELEAKGGVPEAPKKPRTREELRARWALHRAAEEKAAAELAARLAGPRNLRPPLPTGRPGLDSPMPTAPPDLG